MIRHTFIEIRDILDASMRSSKLTPIDLTPIPRIELPEMTNLSQSVREQVQEIIQATIEHSSNLRLRDVVRFKLAERFINSHGDVINYVSENEKAGKKTFKEVVQNFCTEHKLGSVSLGYQELIYGEDEVHGIIEFNYCTDKTFGFGYMLNESLVDDFVKTVKNRDNMNSTPILTRLSMDSRGNMVDNNILFNAPKINMPSNIMYPWFDESPEDFAKAFMEAAPNVLVLYGDPGTGKTTFIKRMLQGIGFNDERTISVIDTPGVMNSPDLVNTIYTSKHKDIFIFEDVDRHLYSREEGNDIMAGLLNAAEGLASPDVKIIISTNIQNLSAIDSALIRPGRCFKTLEFLKLEEHQQLNVRQFLGLDVAICTKERQSLAAVMNEPATEGMTSSGFL